MIEKYKEEICEELEGAKNYAECYVDCKVRGSAHATKYKEMAAEELKHAGYLYDMAGKYVEEMKKAITIPEEMKRTWEECTSVYVCKSSQAKQMLTL